MFTDMLLPTSPRGNLHVAKTAAALYLDSMNKKFVDLQVNGYGGTDFNRPNLTATQLHTACELLDRDNVDAVLATIITDSIDRMCERIRLIVRYRQFDPLAQRIIKGFHIEGPFINENRGFRGAHPVEQIHPANIDEMNRILDTGEGLVRLVTLSPERDEGFKVTSMLAGKGLLVAAGHTDASLDQLKGACDAGLRVFTHLGNGCPMELHRHDNIIQRGLSLAGRLKCGLIADCVHVPMPAIANYIQLAGIDNCFVVTDGTSASGMGPGNYSLGEWDVVVGEDLVCMAPDKSHLLGSAVTMQRCLENLQNLVGLSREDATKLVCDNPAAILGV